MSEAANTTAAPAVTEPAVAPVAEPVVADAAPVVTEPTTTTEEAVTEAPADAAEKTEVPVAAPITEGELAYKGPGLLKSLIPSKKSFWLSDDAVAPQHLDLYLRGEKPETSNPVVAWASQTGKGLLFFNKKGDLKREHPNSVLPLYDASDLKKAAGHEITFKLHGHLHTLKATSDEERDGWYQSLEKSVEIGKSQKETIRESEGYKAEIEKLNKPNVGAAAAVGGAGAAAGTAAVLRSKSKGKKEEDAVKRAGSDGEEEVKKARSTSRGILNRFKGNKDDAAKKEIAAETPAAAVVESETAGAPLDAEATAERVVAAPVEETAAVPAAVDPVTVKADEKPKVSKRNSIFGKIASIRSPTKEKDLKEAELKPEAAKEEVSEVAPQIPATDSSATAPVTLETAEVAKPEAEKAAETEAVSPSSKGNFLSAFMNKRNRSVSPSANLKEQVKKETETPETAAVQAEAVSTPAAATTEAATDAEKTVEESAKEETPNKRQSVFGNLGRRASKALKGIQGPRKENASPAVAAVEKEEAVVADAAPASEVVEKAAVQADKPVAATEPAQIGDVVPEAVNIGHPQGPTAVSASA